MTNLRSPPGDSDSQVVALANGSASSSAQIDSNVLPGRTRRAGRFPAAARRVDLILRPRRGGALRPYARPGTDHAQ